MGQLHVEVLLLPLADADDHRIVRAHGLAHLAQDIGGEPGAARQALGAIGVLADIHAVPEELVDQIAVGAVQLDGVEPQPLGVSGGLGKGADGVGDVLLAHGLAELASGTGEAGRAVIAALRLPFRVAAAHRAYVPELGRHQPTGRVDLVDHMLPGRQFGVPVEARDSAVIERGRPIDPRTLRDDQPHLGGRAASIVLGHILRGHAAGRLGPGHGRHHDAVGEAQTFEFKGAEKSVGGHWVLSNSCSVYPNKARSGPIVCPENLAAGLAKGAAT